MVHVPTVAVDQRGPVCALGTIGDWSTRPAAALSRPARTCHDTGRKGRRDQEILQKMQRLASTHPTQRAARHYSECIMRSQLTARQLANFLREYARARPELQRGSVQRAMNDFLNAPCGRPLD